MPVSYSQEILDQYPQPLAATYARFLDQRDPAAQHTLLLALFEALLKYLAAAAAARYLAADGDDPAVAAALGHLRRPSLGHWAALLRSSLAWWARQDQPDQEFVLPELPSLYARPAELPAVARLLRQLQPSGASTVVLRQLIDALVEYRNQQAHGAGQGTGFYSRMVPLLQTALEEVLLALPSLAARQLEYLEGVSLRRSGQRSLSLLRLMGSRPLLRPHGYTPPPAEPQIDPEELYLMLPDSLAGAVPLLPLLVFVPECATCGDAQVGVLNSASSKAAEYLCYGCGHSNDLPQLAPEVAGFLSRFGIELAVESAAVQPEQPFAAEGASAAAGREAPNNLPAELGRFIGRQAEIAALREQLSRTRLLTICGGAGVGKTRTALQLARETASQFKDGVGFVELGSVADADRVVQAVASVFGVREGETSLKESLTFYLQQRTVLLVLDNCEHLLDACADFIDALLRRSADLKVIATTRERLDIDGEIVYGLEMLPLPTAPEDVTVADLLAYPALQLFVEESVNADPAFTVTDQNIVQIAEICKHLDGNALAIKLAASLTPTLSVGEMLERLRERFDVLVQGRRQAVARHKTLKAAMDWSYELLTPEEATLFRRLAVFADSWTLEAVEHVCADDRIRPSALVPLLNGLVRKSLVLKIPGGTESRFDMLETVREYARMQLQASGDMERLQLEHARYFTMLAKREAGKVWGREPEVGLARLEQDYADLVSALEWTRTAAVGKESGLNLQLAAELGPFWEHRGFLSEGRERLAQALRDKRRPEHDRSRVAALEAAARLAFLQSEYAEAIALYEKSLKLRREMASEKQDTRLKHGVVGVLNKIGVAAARNGDFGLAEQRLREALDLAEATNHTRGIVGAIDHLAEVAWRQGDFDTALERYRECLRYARQQRGKVRDLSTLDSLIGQGKVLLLQARYDEAAAAFAECLDVLGAEGNKTDLAYAHSDLSEVAFRQGDYATAWQHAEESLRLRQAARSEWGIATAQQQLAQVAHKRGRPAEALRRAKESLATFERLQAKRGLADSLLLVAAIAQDNGDQGVAAQLFGAAEMLLDSRGAQLARPQRAYYEKAHLARARALLDPQAWAAGRDLSLERAVLLAQGYAPEEP
jgi:non-specific serine/threonine protein kinase